MTMADAKKITKQISKLSTTNCIIALPVILDQTPKIISRITRIIIKCKITVGDVYAI